MTDALFVGVDGGGTKTHAVVVDSQKRQLGTFVAGGSNRNSVGPEQAAAQVRASILGALKNALGAEATEDDVKAQLLKVKVVVCGVAGCDRPQDVPIIKAWVEPLFETTKPEIAVYNDSVSALASGTLGVLNGVVLICGTGMISYGRNSSGAEKRAGGNGNLIDDGSGYAIALSGLRATFEANDKVGPETALTAAILKRLNFTEVDDLLGWLYTDLSWARVAQLAPIVMELAESDKVAQQILEKHAKFLADRVKNVAKHLGFTDRKEAKVPIVFAGGILQNPLMARLVTDDIRSELPGAEVVHPTVEPATGSALLAVNMYNERQKAQQS